MSAASKPKTLTPAEYLAIERKAEFKSEFYRGEMFAMAGASREHNIIKENLVVELGSRLKGGPCRTLSGDQRVKVLATGLNTYPDILIVSRVAFLAIAYLLSSGWAHLAASYTQKLWMRVKRKAAYLPG